MLWTRFPRLARKKVDLIITDTEELGVDAEALCASLRNEARVAVVPGAARWFGPGAEGHLRVCLATSEGILTEGLRRLTTHLRRLG
jgi:bifunctional pyridoxal-dependent enzyme with beta-cystathionase and maltose regulon repressor activities